MFDRQGRRKYLNNQERRAFYEVAKQNSDISEKAFCLTLLYTGCRISEGLHLTLGRVDFSQRSLVFETLKQGQNGVFRSVPIPNGLCALLCEVAGTAKARAMPATARRRAECRRPRSTTNPAIPNRCR